MAIPLIKDPIVTELKSIVESKLAMPCTFVHANLFEANFGLDRFAKDSEVSFPVCVHVANGKSDNEAIESHDIKRSTKVFLLLLNKYDAPTKDYSSVDVNPIIYQMHQLSDNLAYWINKSTLSVNGGVDKWNVTDVYEKFDAHLFGVAVEFEWTLDKGSNGYLNRSY